MKIISGGQTGVDRIALEVARALGIATGGFCPAGWLTENGPDPSLEAFGLQCTKASSYPPRTQLNVQTSDATVWFGLRDPYGHKCTLSACTLYEKPFIQNPGVAELTGIIRDRKISILNVAGTRGSRISRDYATDVSRTLLAVLTSFSPSFSPSVDSSSVNRR